MTPPHPTRHIRAMMLSVLAGACIWFAIWLVVRLVVAMTTLRDCQMEAIARTQINRNPPVSGAHVMASGAGKTSSFRREDELFRLYQAMTAEERARFDQLVEAMRKAGTAKRRKAAEKQKGE